MAKLDRIAVTPDHESFLYELYADTRAEEMNASGWSETQSKMFLRMQFEAQSLSYAVQYPEAKHWIIRWDSNPIGRLMVAYGNEDIRIVDISLLTNHRNRGVGTTLITEIQQEATQYGLPLRLHVFQTNRAFELYRRMGFQIEEVRTPYNSMVWHPDRR
jgi:Acetyltransferases